MKKIKRLMIVALIATMATFNGCKKESKDNAAAPTPAPIAAFSFTGAGGVAPATVVFSNASTNATNYVWDFGDNGSSTSDNPQHVYITGGAYTVKLTAIGAGGSNSISQTVTIQNGVGVVANFTIGGGGCQAPCAVTLTNTSTNATSYAWDFGDGSTSTQQNPSHTYTSGGNFNIQLTATGALGSNTITKSVNIQNVAGVVANFNVSGGGCQAPCVVTFTNTSQNATSYSWDFGDGSTSTQQNPTHTYTTGSNFNVRLTATGASGSNSVTKSVSVLAAPTVCKISGVSILNCPLVDLSGAGWDAISAPDFYFNLENSSGGILVDGSASYYTDNSSFPQGWTLNPTTNISNSNWGSTYKVHIWEHDSPDADDDVKTVSFVLSNYTTVSNHYPSQFTITNGTTQVQLTVSWQ